MRRQRIYGLLLVLMAVLLPVLDGGDATASLVLGGLGAWMMVTKQYLLYDDNQKTKEKNANRPTWRGRRTDERRVEHG